MDRDPAAWRNKLPEIKPLGKDLDDRAPELLYSAPNHSVFVICPIFPQILLVAPAYSYINFLFWLL